MTTTTPAWVVQVPCPLMCLDPHLVLRRLRLLQARLHVLRRLRLLLVLARLLRRLRLRLVLARLLRRLLRRLRP